MRLYRLLLLLLPREFREEYEPELLDTLQEQWRDRDARPSPFRRLLFWPRQWWALVLVALDLHRDRARSERGSWSSGLLLDARASARGLIARPGFSLAAVLTMGLGVGATTTMFSTLHAVLLRPLPYANADEVVVLRQQDMRDGTLAQGVSAANVVDLARTARTLSHVGFAESHGLRLLESGRAVSVRAWLVSEGFLNAVGAEVALGRPLAADEFVDGNERVVLLSHASWTTRFGSDPEVIGTELVLDGAVHRVVGVLAPFFKFPSQAEIWGPRPQWSTDSQFRDRANLATAARLAPGVSIGQARAELAQLARGLQASYGDVNTGLGFVVTPLRDFLFGNVAGPLKALLGAVAMVFFIAVANVAGLQLARGAVRAREYAVRGALGANAGRLLRLVLAESMMLALAGCALGVGIALVGVEAVRLLGPADLPRLDEVSVDLEVLVFALLLSTGAAILSALVPAFRAAMVPPAGLLASGGRSSEGRRTGQLRDRLVVFEIALALILTVGAGLLFRSFDRLLETELGFEPAGRLVAQVWAYDEDHSPSLSFFAESVERLGTLPGVETVGLTTSLPLADNQSLLARAPSVSFTLDSRPDFASSSGSEVTVSAIDERYPAALGIALTDGRGFSAQDDDQGHSVVMVNEAFVRRYLSGINPIGEGIALAWRGGESREIIGVLADVRSQGVESPPSPEAYVPLRQEPSNGLTFVVKTRGGAAPLLPSMREVFWDVDPNQAVWAMRPLEDLLGDWTRERRFNATLLSAFAGLALLLAGLGVYGLMAFSIEQRIKELGIRRALGSEGGAILQMVLREGLQLAAVGVLIGLAGAVALSRVLGSMLYQTEPLDFPTFLAVSAFVLVVVTLAAFVPARRATLVDPMVALRSE